MYNKRVTDQSSGQTRWLRPVYDYQWAVRETTHIWAYAWLETTAGALDCVVFIHAAHQGFVQRGEKV